MIGRSAARVIAAGLLGLVIYGVAYGGGGRGRHVAGHGGHFHGRVFIGGVLYAPFYYLPPPYYAPYYYSPPAQHFEPYPLPSVAQPSYLYYCPEPDAYYPDVEQCPGGWERRVAPPPR